jgi:hypothetical protein
MKKNPEAVMKEQAKIVSKLSFARPPAGSKISLTKLNKNLVIVKPPMENKSNFVRKSAFVEKSTLSISKKATVVDKSMLAPFLPSLSMSHSTHNLSASIRMKNKSFRMTPNCDFSQSSINLGMSPEKSDEKKAGKATSSSHLEVYNPVERGRQLNIKFPRCTFCVLPTL